MLGVEAKPTIHLTQTLGISICHRGYIKVMALAKCSLQMQYNLSNYIISRLENEGILEWKENDDRVYIPQSHFNNLGWVFSLYNYTFKQEYYDEKGLHLKVFFYTTCREKQWLAHLSVHLHAPLQHKQEVLVTHKRLGKRFRKKIISLLWPDNSSVFIG